MSRFVKIAWMALFVLLQLVDVAVLDPVAFGQTQAPASPAIMTLKMTVQVPSTQQGQPVGGLIKGECHDGCHGLHAMALPAGASVTIGVVNHAHAPILRHPPVTGTVFAPPVPPPNS